MEPDEGEDPLIWSLEFKNILLQILLELVNIGWVVNGLVHVNMWSPIALKFSAMTSWTYIASRCHTKFS
jgi:hypothetical protein